ncbi:hypothetical protein EV421DRAFT_2087678 [Armillaria borealis]|uniref:Uncharacterized protein n=1 Tax=Armillaria borealis TaxID=47425 RepID=A0AA39J271_9AGAR|nr:hypothetical protein EV421DRAFT_2087678 [Armillaria borealis]
MTSQSPQYSSHFEGSDSFQSLPSPPLVPIGTSTDEPQNPDLPSPQSRHCSASEMISNPYCRLYAKKDGDKRRKIWSLAFEKHLFTPHELSVPGARHRREIYVASLEAHIDRLHAQLYSLGLSPVLVNFDELKPLMGLSSKRAKSMVSSLQHDASITKLKLLELERANKALVVRTLHHSNVHDSYSGEI